MSEEVALAAGDIAHWRMRAEQAEAMLRTVTAALEQAEADAATAYEDAARICDREATEKTGEWRGPPDYRWGARKCAEYIRNHAAIADHPGAALLAEMAAAREANHRAAIEIARLTAVLRQAAQMKTILGMRRIVEDAIGVAP